MPIYEYRCAGCGVEFEEVRLSSAADDPCACPQCGHGRAKRLLSTFTTGGTKSGGTSSGGACGTSGGFT